MKNFKLYGRVDTDPFLQELISLEKEHSLYKVSTGVDTYHIDTSFIFFKMPDFVGHGKKTIPAAQELGGMFYPEYSLFKSLPALFDQIVHTVEGNELLWAVLANLKPSGRIIPHIDNHTLASCYRRIHVPIQSDEGNYLISGGEKHHMKIGEVWFFNNYVLHEGANDSTRPRLHLILDIKVDDE